MLRVAIVGCGKIADLHLQAIDRIPGCGVVAACDRELLMVEQLAERFGIAARFTEVGEMLQTAHPDVVHVTTPPQSHFSIARECLEAGCHVYIEKPFTVTDTEAVSLIELARSVGKLVTAGHNLQFANEMLEMRRCVAKNFLGGPPVHLESHFSYSLADTSYVGPLLGNPDHWVRQLPGQLFQNILSHGIAKLAEFLDEDGIEVTACGHQSQQLQELGGEEVLDELRVLLRDARGTTAFFCFTTQIGPSLNRLRICGPNGSLEVDHCSGSLMRFAPHGDKSYLTFFLPPLRQAWQHLRNGVGNIALFLRRRLYQDAGMKELIEQFYESARKDAAPPIPYREILLTAQIMDKIFAQVHPVDSDAGLRAEAGLDRTRGLLERSPRSRC